MSVLDADEAEDLLDGPNHIATVDLSDHRWYVRQMVVYMDENGHLRGFVYLHPKTENQEGQDRFESVPVETFPVVERKIVSKTYERAG